MGSFSPATQLDELDEFACAILSAGDGMMRETLTGKAKMKIEDPSMRCVAVADANGTLLIAANNFFVTRDLVRRMPRVDKKSKWNKVKSSVQKGDPICPDQKGLFDIWSDTSADARERFGFDRALFVSGIHTYLNNYHAEMQILQFMLEYGIKPARPYIGVSKPCCPECSKILRQAAFSFAETHPRNAHVVRNVTEAGFAHPHIIPNLAERLGATTRGITRSPSGAWESPI